MKRITLKSRRNATAQFEALENRQMMSVSPFVINGTNGNDVINVNVAPPLVLTQNAVAQTVTAKAAPVTTAKIAAAVKTTLILPPITVLNNRVTYTIDGVTSTAYLQAGQTIQVNGLAGNDAITVTGKVNADIEGGTGNDSLTGGSGNDNINGGDGNDVIHAGTGNDILHGNAGDDIIFGGVGSSTEFGDDGNDSLYAGKGRLSMIGGNGDDVMVSIGGNVNDVLLDTVGNNSFWVGAGQIALGSNSTNLHRVTAYDSLKVNGQSVGTPSLAMNVGNLPDPTLNNSNLHYKNFSNVPLFSETPVPADINQGILGDCYFMATLSAVAKNDPNLIRQSVVDLGDGTYAVDFKKNGADHFIRVDADLPVDSRGNLADAHFSSEPASLWVPIMEKAWAFFRTGAGTYASTESGFPSEAFNALGVSNSSYMPHHEGFLDLQSENATDFGNHMCSLLAAGDSVVLCTPDDSMYLEGSHCYMLDHVTEVNGKVTSIVFRNPWGTDGRGGNGPNDGYISMTALDVLESVDLVSYAKA